MKKLFTAMLMSLALIGSAFALTPSGPIEATHDGQVIEGFQFNTNGVPAVTVRGFSNVTIRNSEIFHQNTHGILAVNAPGLTIEDVSVVNTFSGQRLPDVQNNIHIDGSSDVTVRRVRLRGGSAGAWLVNSPGAHFSMIEGYDFRGPFPRGQLVQFDKSPGCLLEDFSVINVNMDSWAEDNVSAYYSDNCIIRRGLIDGNNSPSGVGVMFEHAFNGLVEDVDTVRMGNGAFSAYPSYNITFRNTRSRDNFCTDQRGEGPPKSNALVWAGSPDSYGLRLETSKYFALCNPNNKVWDATVFEIVDIASEDFSPRAPIVNVFSWEGVPTPEPVPEPTPTPEPVPADTVTRSEFDKAISDIWTMIDMICANRRVKC
jgi:hypothetical protein